jgi:UDPglucose 6-dehydrogenase
MNIAVVGTGYVGLVSGTCFAETGNQVICVDIDEKKVDKLRSGNLTIYEPGLEILFERNTEQGRLTFTTDLKEAVQASDIIFLALPTPPGEDGSADLSYVLGVASQLSNIIEDYKVVVDKSTVPVGTAELVAERLGENLEDSLFDVVSNPEFLREGVAVDDFLKPDRVVIGTDSDKAQEMMRRLYQPFVRQGNPIIFMDIRSAEMTKYAANSYLATRITFMNEIANLCEKLGANVDDVRKGMGSDTRIGKRFLFPGVGFGGSCFPKDVQALLRTANKNAYDFQILKSVLDVNSNQRRILVDKISSFFENKLSGKKIGLWGLSFKPNTDDIREAPALYVVRELLDKGALLQVYDPEAMDNFSKVFEPSDQIKYVNNLYDAVDNADALAIMTEWSVFRVPDFAKIQKNMKGHAIFDGRNLYDLEYMRKMDFHYESIGRNTIQ